MTETETPIMLITGASRGIGAAVARMAVDEGYAVCLNYAAQAQAANDLADSLRARGGQVITVAADVADPAQVAALFRACDQQWGRLDALVNNAGVLSAVQAFEAMTVERWRRLFDVNVIGSFLCAQEAIKRMSRRHGGQGGSIVNLSSRAAQLGSPNEFVDYAATKGAIDTFTIGLAKELAPDGIRVNAVRPGLIDTDIHASAGDPNRVARMQGGVPMQRGGSPEEVASAVLYFASPASSYSTGSFLDVGGGR